jgi:hypothetical protein
MSPFYRETPEIITKPSGFSEKNEIGHRHHRRFNLAGRRDEASPGRSEVAGLNLWRTEPL